MDNASSRHARSELSGHTLPGAGAVMKHASLGVRLVLSWEACAASPLDLRHRQVTPNHVLYEAGGEPVVGDGAPAHDEGFLDVALEDVIAQLTPAGLAEVTAAHGSAETWARLQQPGLIGAANTVVIDGESGYFPSRGGGGGGGDATGPRGRLLYEDRSPDRHVVTAECVEFFRPHYDLTRARRTVALSADGVAWVVDDYRADGEHRFNWQAYLRRGCSLADHSLRVPLGNGTSVALGWRGADDVALHRFPTYPAPPRPGDTPGLFWPDAGSERLRLGARRRAARFVVCIVPGAAVDGGDGVAIDAIGHEAWCARWAGRSNEFRLPDGAVRGD